MSDPLNTTAPRVVGCYAVLHRFMPACGFPDFTDGVYEGNAQRPYEEAQARQTEVLLDRVGCQAGTRLLDIGCGYGRILHAAKKRGATAVGITVSPEQVKAGRRAGLDVRLLDYKRLGPEWDGQFDAVIANGSLEHFAQPSDAVAGRDDEVYKDLFRKVHRVLADGGRFVTTAIHFRHRPDPNDLLRPPTDFPYGSDDFHWGRLARAFGGWYPLPNQLERCATDRFELFHEEDGTIDYHLTSEEWLRGVRRVLHSPRGLLVGLRAAPLVVWRPLQLLEVWRCLLGSESWSWQFRGTPSPALLFRHTWRRQPG